MTAGQVTQHVVARLRELAAERGYTVNELARLAGVSRGYLSRLLRAEQSPTLDTLEKLAAALKVEVRELLE